MNHDYETDQDAELDDLRAEARHQRRVMMGHLAHPNCQDPDHDGCPACECGDDE
jgi:hypothetical protein